MRVVVTGARGKVGRAVVAAMQGAGHEVTEVDLVAPVFEAALPGEPRYLRADLTDVGEAFAVVRGAEVVVHAAAIPDPLHHPPQVVFHNNVMSVFNVLEAAVRMGVRRLVNISSETVPGFFFPERESLPDYLPVDELHPIRPQDPYAIGKHVSELLMDAAVRRSDLLCTSIRPSWVQHAGNIERNLGPIVRERRIEAPNFGCYVHADDLAEAIRLAAESDLPGHEVFYVAAADNAAGLPLGEAVRARYGDRIELRLDGLAREDASAISCAKAERLLGWRPKRSWRDHLDADGRALA
ncbi:MAG TPA: NAD(P)-dependent oxidoreductase [Actinomycetes bacterium]